MKRNRNIRSAIMAGFFMGAVASGAAAQGWQCQVDASTGNGWIAPSVNITLDSSRSASVHDGITDYYEGGAVQARARQTRNGHRISWSVNAEDDLGNRIRMRYTANIDADNAIHLRADPVDFRGNLSGRGTCWQN